MHEKRYASLERIDFGTASLPFSDLHIPLSRAEAFLTDNNRVPKS